MCYILVCVRLSLLCAEGEGEMTKLIILMLISLPFMLSIGKVCDIVETNDTCFAMCVAPLVMLWLMSIVIVIVDRRKYGNACEEN